MYIFICIVLFFWSKSISFINNFFSLEFFFKFSCLLFHFWSCWFSQSLKYVIFSGIHGVLRDMLIGLFNKLLNTACWCLLLPKTQRLPFSGFLTLEVSFLAVGNRSGRCRCVHCRGLQRTHLQQPLLRMSPTAGDETSRGRNPENGKCWDFRRRGHRQSGFQYTYKPQPSSPELFNKNHNSGRESLSHLKLHHLISTLINWWCPK